MQKNKIQRPVFLTGYMCSGKTTLGRALARALGCEFIDLDDVVEARAGRSISDIFATEGEAAFRAMECEALRSVAGGPPAIIALGGGTPCHADNMDIVNGSGLSVWLVAPVSRLVERLVEGAAKRPLVAGKSRAELTAFVTKTLAERQPYYNRAHCVFDSSRLEDEDQIAHAVDLFIATIL